ADRDVACGEVAACRRQRATELRGLIGGSEQRRQGGRSRRTPDGQVRASIRIVGWIPELLAVANDQDLSGSAHATLLGQWARPHSRAADPISGMWAPGHFAPAAGLRRW